MLKRFALVAMAAAAVLTLTASPAAAVPFGEPDGDAHPYVGLAVFYLADGTPSHRCSGALVTPELFLTAAHCTAGVASAKIWLTPDVTSAAEPLYPFGGNDAAGTPIAHPGWTGVLTVPETHDVGVITLNAPVTVSRYATLAPLGFLDALATERGTQDVTFTVVGYGVQQVKPVDVSQRIRTRGTVHLQNLRSNLTGGSGLQTSNNGGHWSGGTCFGDSGGPVLYANTDMVVSVNSFVLNANCKGTSFSYRVDTTVARDFLGPFL